MRKNDGDMEIALEVPQPRLRAVPSDPAPPDDSVSDAELLARVGEHDREAFEILYGRYIRPVFGLALRRLGDRGHAVNDGGVKRFGSGWSWLVWDGTGLAVYSTPNQDSPILQSHVPLLGIDVWEHAYYLKYQNKRPAYLEAWWNVVNWPEVERRFAEAQS